MNTIMLMLASITGLLAVWLYLNFAGQHAEQHREQVIQHRLDAERFDREFADGLNGRLTTPDDKRDTRITDLEAELAGAKQRRAKAEEEARATAAEIKKALDDSLKSPTDWRPL